MPGHAEVALGVAGESRRQNSGDADGFFEIALFRAIGNVRIALLLLILVVALATPARLNSPLAVYTGLIIGVLLTFWTRYAARWRQLRDAGRLDVAAGIVVVGDVTWLGLFVLGTGGVQSPFAPLLLVPILFSCALLGLSRIAVVVSAAIVVALELAFALGMGWGPDLFWHFTGGVFALLAVTWVAFGLSTTLERERRTNELVIRYLDEAVLLVGADGSVRLANPQIERIVGLPVERLIGTDLRRLPDDDAYAPLREIAHDVFDQTNVEHVRDIQVESPERLELRISTLRVGDVTRPMAWLVICQDVTDLKSIARARSHGARVLSHEIRSPLTTLKTISSVFSEIADQLDDASTSRLSEILGQEVDRMLRLARRFLDLAAFDEGTCRLQREEVDIGELVDRVVAALRVRAEEKGLTVSVAHPDELPTVSADPQRIEDVLHNLADNALKYTPSGGSIQVRCGHSDGEVSVAVSDTGCGIPEELQEDIFREFVRGPSTGGGGQEGIGLGLFMARQIVEMHGGSIELQSEAGEGSTFIIHLPIEPAT